MRQRSGQPAVDAKSMGVSDTPRVNSRALILIIRTLILIIRALILIIRTLILSLSVPLSDTPR